MYILSIETTGRIGTVALGNIETGDIAMLTNTEDMSHLRNMTPLANQLLSAISPETSPEDGLRKLKEKGLKAVAVSIGPGSFTGIRIGVTLARSIAQAADIPAISVPTLEVFRERCAGSPVAAIINARRGQVYGGVFDGDENLLAPGPYMLDDVLEITDKYPETVFYGDGVDAYRDILEDGSKGISRIFAPEEERYQRGDLVWQIAKIKYEAGDVVGYNELLPDYMRLAEAEQKLKDGTLQKLREEKMAKLLGK